MGNLALAPRFFGRQAKAMSFLDRMDAGRRLGERLLNDDIADPVVIGLPRGGVVVAAEVARVLGAPLEVVVVRKLGAPGRPELGIGAISEGGIRVLNDDLIDLLHVTGPELAGIEARETEELNRRVLVYRGDRDPVGVAGRTAVVVDDGLATGSTARAALRALRARKPARLVLAVPVSARDTAAALRQDADDVIALELPPGFGAVGQWYQDFRQTEDEEVIRLLGEFRRPGPVRSDVWVPIENGRLPGVLAAPTRPHGVVVFAHGSGSSRHSPRNQAVADVLNDHGFGTLLFDLLTEEEASNRANVFDIDLLASRLSSAVDWANSSGLPDVPVGLFGASTGAAAALLASVHRPVAAVVSRGGRPDLAGPRLSDVTVPVLLMVGSRDTVVLDLTRAAAEELSGPWELSVVPGAGHLFEEAGTLADVAHRAANWFARWLVPESRR